MKLLDRIKQMIEQKLAEARAIIAAYQAAKEPSTTEPTPEPSETEQQ